MLRKKTDRGDLINAQIYFEATDHHYHEQFMESFSSANYSKWDDDRAWSAQEWKTDIKTYHSVSNTKDLTLQQMFDISSKLVSEQDEISGLETIGWENHSWTHLSLIADERIINLQGTNNYVFSDSVLCLVKILQNTQSNDAW